MIYLTDMRPRVNNCHYTLDATWDRKRTRLAYRRLRRNGFSPWAARCIITDLLMCGRYSQFHPNTLPPEAT